MVFDIIEFGGGVFWTIIVIDYLILTALPSPGRIGLTVGSTGIIGVVCDLPIIWDQNLLYNGFGYFGIGLISFFVLYSINIRLIRKDLRVYAKDKGISANGVVELLDNSEYSAPHDFKELHQRYHNEPSWEGFFDRLICWPTAIPNFFLGDFLRSITDSVAKWLVQRRDKVIGIER